MALPPLATVDQLAIRAGRPASDPILAARLTDASRRFREAVGWDVSRTEGAHELNGDGGRILLLPVKHIDAVTAVTIDDVALTARRDYRVDRRNGMLERIGGVWPTGLGRIEVRYIYGFDAETRDTATPPGLLHVPEGIQGAVLGMAEILLNVTAGLVSRTVLGDTIQFGAASTVGTTQDWAEAVNDYRIRAGA